MNLNQKFVRALEKDAYARKLSLLLSVVFFIFYLWSIENIIFGLTDFSLNLSANWQEIILKARASFLWEPIGRINSGFFTWFISIPNIILGTILATLFFMNIFLAIFTYRLPKTCRVNKSGLIGVLPASLTGFACCAPTFLIAIAPLTGASATAFFTDFAQYLIPISIALLIAGFFLMLYQFPEKALVTVESN